jgi:hypothetical protein
LSLCVCLHHQSYDSSLWTSTRTLNPTSLAFDRTDAKLDAYNLFLISTVRVGMSDDDGSALTFIDLPLESQYASMLELMSANTFTPTHAGRAAWLDLGGPGASLELGCSREGFNNHLADNYNSLKVRVGVLAGPPWRGSGEASCEAGWTGSFIGLGAMSFTSVSWPCGNSPMSYGASSFSSGNVANLCPWWFDPSVSTVSRQKFGYLLGGNVQPSPPPPPPPPPPPSPSPPPPPPPPPPSPPPPPPPPPSPPSPPSPPPPPPSPPLAPSQPETFYPNTGGDNNIYYQYPASGRPMPITAHYVDTTAVQGYGHSHGGWVTFELNVHTAEGAIITLWSQSVSYSAQVSLPQSVFDIGAYINVNYIAWDSNPGQGYSFHNINGALSTR